jgi:hypothetical protein
MDSTWIDLGSSIFQIRFGSFSKTSDSYIWTSAVHNNVSWRLLLLPVIKWLYKIRWAATYFVQPNFSLSRSQSTRSAATSVQTPTRLLWRPAGASNPLRPSCGEILTDQTTCPSRHAADFFTLIGKSLKHQVPALSPQVLPLISTSPQRPLHQARRPSSIASWGSSSPLRTLNSLPRLCG